MLLINGLKFTTPPKNFEDFDNMFREIDPESHTLFYIATLVYNKVILECNPTRSNEVNAWLGEKWHDQQQQYSSEPFSDEDSDSVGDIID